MNLTETLVAPLPPILAQHLRHGEALVWWNAKHQIARKPLIWIFSLSLMILIGISLIVPEFWLQPLSDIWQPIAVWFSPTALVALREGLSCRAILITDGAIIDVPRWGPSRRLTWQSIQKIRRDLLIGGMQLKGQGLPVRIPMSLAEEVRQVVSQQIKNSPTRLAMNDSVGWL